jgi:hypothetical protein
METEYKIKLYDNGWTLEDSRSLAKQVVQEKDSDKKHIKIKHLLGEWLYEDMDDFLNEIEDIECVIEIKFKKTEEEE